MGITDDFKWLKAHLLLLAVTVTLVVGSIYAVLDKIESHDKDQAARYEQLAEDEAKRNIAFQQQTQQQINALVAQNQQLAVDVATLAQAVSQRQIVENKIPKQNENLSAVEAAKALGGTTQGDNVVLELPIARTIVTDVQLVPLLQKDKADLVKENGLLQTEVSNAGTALDLERKAHASDNSSNVTTIKARESDISALKADLRKSKIKWFFIGYVAGLVTGKFAGI